MKQTFKYILVAVAAISAFACTKEAGIETPAGTIVFSATLEQPAKADLNGRQVVWAVGDQIAVSNGTDWATSAALTEADITEGGLHAAFSVEIAEGASYTAVYPAAAKSSAALPGDAPAGAVMISLPAEQIIPDGKVAAPEALVQIATSDTKDKLSFKNVTSLVKIEIPEEGINGLFVDALGAESAVLNLAGAAMVTPEPTFAKGKTGRVTLRGTFVAGQSYYAVVLPQQEVKALRIGLSKPGAKAIRTGTVDAGFSLPVNGGKIVSDMGTIKWFDGTINTKADLDLWALTYNLYSADETVKLGADIDYQSGVWTPVNGREASGFGGAIDGQNHSIYNIVINADAEEYSGFFNVLSGTELRTRVSNIKFGFDPSTGKADGTSSMQASTNASDGPKFGVLAGMASNCEIANVDNYIPVTVGGDVKACQIGGLAGRLGENGQLVKCNNYADMTMDTTSPSGYAGGFVGTIAGSNAVVSGCVNSGSIRRTKEASGADNTFIGGIVGRTGKENHGIEIKDCTNSGVVATTVDVNAKQMYLGGIIGMDNTSDNGELNVTISSCTNASTAVVKTASFTSTNVCGIGGIIGCAKYPSLTENCTNLGAVVKLGDNSGSGKKTHYGGIAGYLGAATSTIKNCINGAADDSTAGSVTDVEQTTGSWNIRMGGILGLQDDGTLEGCKNYGTVWSKNTADGIYEYLGGVTGNHTAGAMVKCENYGEVKVEGTTAKYMAGGIIGLQSGGKDTSTGDGCKVSAAVSCGNAGCAGIVVGGYTSTKTTVIGAEADKIVVKASTVNGAAVNADNYQSYLAGPDSGITVSGTASGKNTIWAVFE